MTLSYADDLYVYIFSWHKTTENALKMHNIIRKYCKNCFIINCDENFKNNENIENIINLDDSYYFGGQFQTAVRNIPDNMFFCNIVADMDINIDWENLFNKAIESFNLYKIGIYSPHDINSVHQHKEELLENNLYNISNTDCTCWFIHPNIISKLKDIDYYGISNYGWGIDWIFCFESKKQNLLVIRDYSIQITQPKNSTGYNMGHASLQMSNLKQYYNNFFS